MNDTGATDHPVTSDDAGARLDVVLARLLDEPRSRAAARIDAGAVTIAGAVVRRSHRVSEGERIVVAADEVGPVVDAPPLPPVRYRDEHLVVLAKPPGLVVHPGPGHAAGTLVDALAAAGVPLAPAGGEGRPGIVHRLDRDTSGLLVVASTDEVHAALVEALRRRQVVRRYLALVDGVPASPVGRIEAPIGRDPDHRRRFATVPSGKDAATRYTTIVSGMIGERPVSLLACRLESGRTHQIRVHLTAIGHPVLGDPVYGSRPTVAAALGLERPALHAGRLAFAHPVTGAGIDVSEPLPDDLTAALQRAGIDPPDVAQVLADPDEG
ncbi:MAG: RluA family pseudouridine synthase [Nitriliruptor sp.]|uniref:RluA family pseudouridine synthase n=1 Tax=Nitriliruptor sp. TaxID=2448056 RepID=UPI0034A08B15